MDARVTVELLGSLSVYDEEKGVWVATRRDEEGRALCTLEVDDETYRVIFREDVTTPAPLYGIRYLFTLKEEFSEVRGEKRRRRTEVVVEVMVFF